MSRTTYHMCMSVRGAIRNRAFKGFTDDSGNPISPRQAEEGLLEMLANGIEVIPLGGPKCEGWSDKTGCPGHPIIEEAGE